MITLNIRPNSLKQIKKVFYVSIYIYLQSLQILLNLVKDFVTILDICVSSQLFYLE